MQPGLGIALLVAVLVACGAPSGQPASTGGQNSTNSSESSASKRLVTSVTSDLASLRSQLNRAAGGVLAGAPELEQLVHAGLAVSDSSARLQPQLAEQVPTIENGMWKVFPDGRMETTWKIRDGTVWQDGTPLTAEDLIFTARVFQDPDVPSLRTSSFDAVENLQALDARTFVATWQKSYINADKLFSGTGTIQELPLPKHLLEQPYQENKSGFADVSYWADDFVGAGPYKLREWFRGSSLTLEAFDRYVLGKPKIGVIEVRFIPDPNTGMANLLSGTVQQPIGRGISFDQGLQLRDQWRDGQINFSPGGDLKVWPQLLNPNPAVINDVRFRRAMLQATDRQEMADTLMAGQVEVAHTIVAPNDPEFPYVTASVVKYDFDPRLAGQAIEGLGYTRGTDNMFRDGSGQPLTVELRSSPMDILRKSKLVIADNWQAAGITVSVVDDSPQLRGNLEYRATFPGFDMSRAGSGVELFDTYTSAEARTPQNRYVGQNGSNYMNPELDALVERYLSTIPYDDRMRAAAGVVHHMTDQVVVMDLFYDATVTALSNRMVNVASRVARRGTNTWNAQDWDMK